MARENADNIENDWNVTELTDVGMEDGNSTSTAAVKKKSAAAVLMYSLGEIKNFLDKTFGKVVGVNFFQTQIHF